MYCAIRHFEKSLFSNSEKVGEGIYDYDLYDLETILFMTKDTDLQFVFDVSSETEDLADKIDELEQIAVIRDNVRFSISLRQYKTAKGRIPFFFALQKSNFAITLDMVKSFCEMGVTDIYTGFSLGFNLKEVKSITDNYGVRIRVVPNVSQYDGYESSFRTGMSDFWIRPEDLELYEDLIDVIEFTGAAEKQKTKYEIYFQDKKWDGNLGILINGIGVDIDNRNLTREFTEQRLNCKKRCTMEQCHFCDKFLQLASLISENDLEVELTKEEG